MRWPTTARYCAITSPSSDLEPTQTLGGGPGCLVQASNEVSGSVTTGAGGGAGVLLRLPGDPWMIGATVYHQWVILDPRAPNNRLGLATTGGLMAIVGL